MARVAQAGLTALALLALAGPAEAAPKLFPSDAGNTVRDATQQTGKRISLRLPACAQRPSDCNDIGLLNRLDGFDLDPRITVRLDRPIDPRRAITRRTLYVEPVDRGPRIGVDRLVYESATRTLAAHPTRLLRGGTRYRLVVDLPGQRASTTFTTMTATLQTRAMRTRSARRPDRLRITHRFAAADVRGMRVRTDTGRGLSEAPVPDLTRAGGGTYAFGTLRARNWLREDRTIEQVPSEQTPAERRMETLGVSLVVPAGTPPRGGWPVAIFGHGFSRSRLDLYLAAERHARRGVATLALTIPGHGGGPNGRLLVDLADGRTADLALRGRSVDLDRSGEIGAIEGAFTALPPSPVASVSVRDVLRQAALDVTALSSAVRRGVDVDGDGTPDLSRTRIGYYGQSFGAIYGAMAIALDARLRPAVLNVGGGPVVDIARLSATFRPLLTAQLGGRVPSALNGGPGGFTEAEPLAGERPVVDPPAGATAIQGGLALARWIQRAGSPEAYAPALIGDRRVLVQVALGDRTVPNPTSAILIRAGGLEDRTALYRNDRTEHAARNPHGFFLDPSFGRQRELAQDQALDFLLRPVLRDPDGAGPVWEVPPRMGILDRLNLPPGS